MKLVAALSLALAVAACATAPAIQVRQPGESEAAYIARQVRTEAGFVCDGESVCTEAQLAARERFRAIRMAAEPAPGRSISVVGGPRIQLASGGGNPRFMVIQEALTQALAETQVRIGRGASLYPDWIAAEARFHEILEASGIDLASRGP
jgi:hypothetical protein